jgi:ATPase family AAA domain-containing protein 1
LSQADLEKALSTSRKTSVAANEYSRMTSRTSFHGESGDSQVEAAIRELSKIMGVSHIQVDAQD